MEGDEAFDDQMDLLQKMKRREAIAERHVKGIKFVIGANKADKVKSSLKGLRHEVVDKTVEQNEEEKEMSVVMGFSKFGPQKQVAEAGVTSSSQTSSTTEPSAKPKARSFDLEQLVQESVHIARQTFAAPDAVRDKVGERSPKPGAGESQNEATDSSEDEDDFVGPPLPPNFSGPQPDSTKTSTAGDSELSDSDDDESTGDRYSRLPTTSDISLQHGSKSISALAG